jgi:hypothetical protein
VVRGIPRVRCCPYILPRPRRLTADCEDIAEKPIFLRDAGRHFSLPITQAQMSRVGWLSVKNEAPLPTASL